MVEVLSRERPHGFPPPEYKRRRVSAIRDYPLGCGMSDPRKGQRAGSGCPVVRKYPPPKIRKGFTIERDFPSTLNAPTEDFNANHVRERTNAKQDDLPAKDVRDCKPMDHSTATKMNSSPEVKESNLAMIVWNGQCQLDIPIATNVYVCRDVEDSSPSKVEDYEVVLKDEKRHKVSSPTKQASLLMVVNDEQDHQAIEGCEDDLVVNSSQEVVCNDLVTVCNNELRNPCEMVKEVLHLFRDVYHEWLKAAEKKCSGLHTQVATFLRKQHKWVNMDKRLGPVPGVEVGDFFDWRTDLSIVGLHHQYVCGIDHMELDGRKLATSIVDSGIYDNVVESHDEQEFSDVLIYSGVGENPKISKKPINDQKLEGGNLALKNSAEAKTPIRVIRKLSFKRANKKGSEYKYVYDGLYFVDGVREERASTGRLVFKFVLKRFPGQPKLDWTRLARVVNSLDDERNDISQGEENMPIRVVNSLDDERNDMSQGEENIPISVVNSLDDERNDISQGEENIPIRVVNLLDDEKLPSFNYITNVTYPKTCRPPNGCDCIGGCSDSEDCPCVIKNGGEIPYNYGECVMNVKPLIVECGPSCKCFTSCLNRVSQRGIRFPLEVFKTERKGWGVRSRSFIPSGGFICEYIGEVLGDNEAENLIGHDEYLFNIGNYHRNSLHDASELSHSTVVNESFTIDAAQYGNVGRFINHSCSPNLYAQEVLFDHDDKRMPHIMLFAVEDIPPLEELTYDYNYEIGTVVDANGKMKVKACHCGSSECNGRMY
ncbi:hypothetical protein COLO4_37315 [Corchorus olitorius]|uniref:SET domain-containing protein n=1 Tax=Corchorus olitorius TaxID=93759 RepID=A0A1R3G2F0_9ROSI|nr:hypothetical protein COLO4_37315 [Corchorus olitorius]